MAEILKGELQDYQGNTLYPHSKADVIFCSDGKTAQEKFTKYENALGTVTGTSGSTTVNDANVLATTEATKKLSDRVVKYENALGNATGTSSSLEVSDPNILATTEATKKLKDDFGTLYKDILPPIPATLPSSGNFCVKRIGNTVTLAVDNILYFATDLGGKELLVCTLPEKYRPSTPIFTMSYHMKSNVIYPMIVIIETDGSVMFSPMAWDGSYVNDTRFYWFGSITWLVD